MKRTLAILALLPSLPLAYGWDVSGNFAWPDTTNKTLTYTEVHDVKEISITDVYSDTAYKTVKYWDSTANEGAGALTGVVDSYTPDINVGNGTGTWTLTFTIVNEHATDTMTLNAITLQAIIYDNAGKFQPDNTERFITFTLGGAAQGSVTATLNGAGRNADSDRRENVTNVTLALTEALEIQAKDSATITLTASPKRNADNTLASNGGTHVGLKGATFALIPEPTTTTLSLLALAGLAVRRRRI